MIDGQVYSDLPVLRGDSQVWRNPDDRPTGTEPPPAFFYMSMEMEIQRKSSPALTLEAKPNNQAT